MAMPFVYVGIEHVSIRFTSPHARAPLGSWSTWSPRLVIVCWNSFHLLPPLRCTPTCHVGMYLWTLRPDTQPVVNNQGQSLLCRASCPCSSWSVPRACLPFSPLLPFHSLGCGLHEVCDTCRPGNAHAMRSCWTMCSCALDRSLF
jgi:hypothetical protein